MTKSRGFSGQRWLSVALGTLTVACVVRFAVKSAFFVLRDLQMDLAVRIFGARSARDGLSPYLNNLTAGLRYWDGSTHVYSSFIFPPSVALFFLPLAALPYLAAKALWTLGSCVAIVVALTLSARLAQVRLDRYRILGLIAIAAVFHPLLLHIERGQFEAFLLLAVMACAVTLDRRPFLAGAFLAPAIALKLHCALLLPFLALRSRWLAILGAGLAFAAIELASAATLGPKLELDYWSHELPRIVRIDDRRSPAGPELPAEVLDRRPGAPVGEVVVDSRAYTSSTVRFAHNATLVRPLRALVERTLGVGAMASSPISLALFGCFFLVVMAKHWQLRKLVLSPPTHLSYWLVALVSVMLSAPLTWVMSLVWVLPAVLLMCSREVRSLADRNRVAAIAACAGLVWIGSPEVIGPDLGPALYHQAKYPMALLLMFPFLLTASMPAAPMMPPTGVMGSGEKDSPVAESSKTSSMQRASSGCPPLGRETQSAQRGTRAGPQTGHETAQGASG